MSDSHQETVAMNVESEVGGVVEELMEGEESVLSTPRGSEKEAFTSNSGASEDGKQGEYNGDKIQDKGQGNNEGGDHDGELEKLRNTFIQSMALDLEPDFEINGELIRTGVLACFFDGKGLSRTRLKEVLGNIWKQRIKGPWRFKTLKLGLWGIFFELEEDCVEILHKRPWIINGKLLIIKEWPEDGSWSRVDMKKTLFWVQATGLLSPYLNRSNIPTIVAKVGVFKNSDTWDQRLISRRGFFKFQVEIDTDQQLVPGSYLDIMRAVMAFGPWTKAETAVISCFNTRNQLDWFNNEAGVNCIPPKKPSEKPLVMVDKGKKLVDERKKPTESERTGIDGRAHPIRGLRRKVIRKILQGRFMERISENG
ncbi:hypothetical protein CsatA_005661 [Cannabis sativa]